MKALLRCFFYITALTTEQTVTSLYYMLSPLIKCVRTVLFKFKKSG